jgi:hypothetical protein
MNDQKQKGGRKAEGTVVRTRDGRWQAIVTLADGSRRRISPPFPKGTSYEYARSARAFGARMRNAAAS